MRPPLSPYRAHFLSPSRGKSPAETVHTHTHTENGAIYKAAVTDDPSGSWTLSRWSPIGRGFRTLIAAAEACARQVFAWVLLQIGWRYSLACLPNGETKTAREVAVVSDRCLLPSARPITRTRQA